MMQMIFIARIINDPNSRNPSLITTKLIGYGFAAGTGF